MVVKTKKVLSRKTISCCQKHGQKMSPLTTLRTPNELAGVFNVFSDHFLCELTSDQVALYQKQERAG